MNMQKVVALVGLSGVGKSTVLAQVRHHVVFQHLEASALIKNERQRIESAPIDQDSLRIAHIGDNQRLLIDGFRAAVDSSAPIVILDGHTLIDTPVGLVKIQPEVFGEINVSEFIMLVDDPEAIVQRRTHDLSRNRPIRSSEEINKYQELAVVSTLGICLALRVRMTMLVRPSAYDLVQVIK